MVQVLDTTRVSDLQVLRNTDRLPVHKPTGLQPVIRHITYEVCSDVVGY
jgi:hypothetical protein